MAVEDSRAEEMEELVRYGMAADNAGEVTGKVTLYSWDAAVPALPLIAQLLLVLYTCYRWIPPLSEDVTLGVVVSCS